jgi:predicted Mrr-cat superfamily restriction endonuclease
MATVWVIRGGERNRLVQHFLDAGEIGVGFEELPDGRSIDRAKAVRLLSGLPDAEQQAARFLSFVRRISVGDLVLMPDPAAGGFPVGVVAGDYQYRDDIDPDRYRHRRAVEWRRRLPYGELPERLKHLPNQRYTLSDVADGRLRDLALRCSRGELGDDPFVRPRGSVGASSGPRTSRPRGPARPPKATIAERRCESCFLVKPAELFEDGSEWCRDCA